MRAAFRWIGIITGLAAGLIVVSAVGLYSLGRQRLNKVYAVPAESVTIPAGAGSIQEGKRIFQYRGCEACHGEQLQGLVYLENPALGQVSTPNLTSGQGGIGSERSDIDLIRAIRHGVRPDGTPLLFMPSTEFYYLSDADLGMAIAYIRSLPPIDHVSPPSTLSVTGFMAMNLTRDITFLPAELIQHDAARPVPPTPGITAEYGQYLSISCLVCHGLNLSGGAIPGFPPEWPAAPNLTSGKGSRLPLWGEEGFIEIIRNGQKHGRRLGTAYMPWTSYRHMNDDELRAVYLYLASRPAIDSTGR